MTPMEIELRTLTPLWTGGVDQICDRVHETGLIGSLRWWYEALVRGLGGYACDPTDEKTRCKEYDPKKGTSSICAACYLFGTTGWARLFRLRVLDKDGHPVQTPLERNMDFRLQFLELRAMCDEEKWLLAKAVEIAAKYGALGGKTTSLRRTYGVVELTKPIVAPVKSARDVKEWLKRFRSGENEKEWADLRHFVFLPSYALSQDPRDLARQISGDFLLGRKKPERSRKIFVLRNPDRTYVYGCDAQMRDEIIRRIRQELGSRKDPIKTGEEVLCEL